MSSLLVYCSKIRCCSRLRLLHLPKHNIGAIRLLSVNETAIALRPFIFTVHPDLFGRFPKERAVNEDSLQRLNEHINQLQCRCKVAPLTLTFYVRGTTDNGRAMILSSGGSAENGIFRAVRIRLVAQNVRDTVRAVLSSCCLPLDYVENISPSTADCTQTNRSAAAANGPPGGDHFAKSVNSTILHRFYGVHAYDQTQIRMQRMARDTLSLWLRNNIDRGRKNLLHMAPTRQEISRLKDAIMEETGAVDIQWQCNWMLASYRTALRGLLRVCRQHRTLVNLKGRTIVFGSDTGVCVQGHVILRHDDIADHWIVTLKSLREHDAMLCNIAPAERRLSALLGCVEITRQPHQPVTMVHDYLCQLRKLTTSVEEECSRRQRLEAGASGTKEAPPVMHKDVCGVQVVIECATGSLMVTQFGQILVPSACPAFLIIDFINSHATEAHCIREESLRTNESHVQTIQQCFQTLGLESLTRDANVTRAQMESCCRRLLQLHKMASLPADLTLCRLQVAQFYSVMSDGDICVPWNFEDIV